ncbi:hypothetical protein ZIOFF_063579 [Zingiber officinale]|uniref:STAR protein homodimerisation region domain-containing protein n=1 Tax=Zingiber officinale TaxID=94328 RepID=A0A8J5KBA8_ZINOF|nr:hypothetical protein ZIOFF_063579 [Zingiber officinale]
MNHNYIYVNRRVSQVLSPFAWVLPVSSLFYLWLLLCRSGSSGEERIGLIYVDNAGRQKAMPPPGYFQYPPSPSGVHSSPSSHHSMRSPAATSDRERYLAELLAERQKLGPFLQVLPFCYRLLNQEIMRASAFVSNPNFVDHERIEHASPLRVTGHPLGIGPMDLEGRSGMHMEENEYFHRIGVLQASTTDWGGTPAVTKSPIVKKVIRLNVPVDKYPNVLV